MKRRHFVLGGAVACVAACVAARGARADAPVVVPGAPNLNMLVGGPDGEQASRWADACAQAMSGGFPGMPNILTAPQGGLDGVTGANRLDALVVPDGKTAALLPGAALLAWMTGDARVHFDPTRWVPVLAGCNSGVLVARLGATAPGLSALQGFGGLRIAVESAQSRDLAVLLALQRMGVQTTPLFGLRGTEAKTKAFVAGEVDAVFLCGEGVPEDVAPLAANAGVPVFSLGQIDPTGAVVADPLFPDVPEAGVFAGQAASMDAAYKAAAAAARLDFFMVLPKLTDPSQVALWRQAAIFGMGGQALAAAAQASSIVLQPAAMAADALALVDLSVSDQASLQDFITQRFGPRPG